jgi:iron-sulfur cluster assembly accessory protein
MRIKELQKQHGSEMLLRILVDSGGCSGFQYKFEVEKSDNVNLEPEEGAVDKIFENNGVRVVIDQISMGFVNGSTLEYKKELIRSSFLITNNPNVELSCGCGTSFAKKQAKSGVSAASLESKSK